ncbi:MAG: fumarylacetoacetate hydrolase family protein [Anaerolineae bacterium]|nr:fumarylacetoacetate hydrolase family protein [Anaerolineae bacterium]
MRLVTFVEKGERRLGARIGEQVVDLTVAQAGRRPGGPPVHDMLALIEAGPEAWARLANDLATKDWSPFARPLEELKLDAPVRPSKIVAIGQNYFDHVREQNAPMPERPIIFAKFPTAVIGPGDEIRWDPALSDQIDWEAELAVVIGRRARRVRAAEAYAYVFGYTVANDVTARDIQKGDGQWVRGKSLDTFCPLGPWIVTRDEVPDPHGLPIRTRVNGRIMQDSRTDQLIFRIPELIEFITRAFTLLPGDIILTGTPPGVGAFRKPPIFLQDGDIVTVEVEGIGALTNPCRTEHD